MTLRILIDNGYEIYVKFCVNYVLGNTLNSLDFNLLIYSAIKKREEHIVSKNKMEILLQPRIAKAIKESNFISSIVLSITIVNS